MAKKGKNNVVQSDQPKNSSCNLSGCPIPMKKGCLMGLPLPTEEEGGLKMICNNEACPFKGQLVHQKCLEALEETLIKGLEQTGSARGWSDSQRRSNLWGRRGLPLVQRNCRCPCDHGFSVLDITAIEVAQIQAVREAGVVAPVVTAPKKKKKHNLPALNTGKGKEANRKIEKRLYERDHFREDDVVVNVRNDVPLTPTRKVPEPPPAWRTPVVAESIPAVNPWVALAAQRLSLAKGEGVQDLPSVMRPPESADMKRQQAQPEVKWQQQEELTDLKPQQEEELTDVNGNTQQEEELTDVQWQQDLPEVKWPELTDVIPKERGLTEEMQPQELTDVTSQELTDNDIMRPITPSTPSSIQSELLVEYHQAAGAKAEHRELCQNGYEDVHHHHLVAEMDPPTMNTLFPIPTVEKMEPPPGFEHLTITPPPGFAHVNYLNDFMLNRMERYAQGRVYDGFFSGPSFFLGEELYRNQNQNIN